MIRRAPGASDLHAYDISGRTPTPINANLTIGSKSAAAKKRARRKVELENTETDLIQDFSFPTVSHRIKISRDGRYVFASGTYPPQIHVYDTDELSLKFKRHVTNDIVDFQILEEDWRKFALLTADRYVDIHSQFGSHFRTRVPRHGRDLMLHQGTCDLFVCGEGAEVWRLNLEQGRFMAPFPTLSGANGGNNVCGMNPVNSLLAFGGESALLDIWDPRIASNTRKPAATLDVGQLLTHSSVYRSRSNPEITSLRFDESDGVTLGVGTSAGISLLFDLRSSKPMHMRDHGNGLPIRSLRMHVDGKHCISADPKSVKVWNKISGANMIAIEPDADINHLCVIGGSGVMCTAVETQRVKTYYVPALGSAPRWCAFLDNFTEELELGKQTAGADEGFGRDQEEEVYENYKFVPHDALEGLGLGHLRGTDLLKSYMHGYFVHQKLYRRAIEVAEPFAYEKYRREKAKEKIDAERQSRISKVKRNGRRKVNVNQKTLETLLQKTKGNKNGTGSAVSVADDERFSAMFSNKDYTVDEEAERYQFLYPVGTGRKRKEESDENSDEDYLEQFELIDERGGTEQRRNEEGQSGFLTSASEEEEESEVMESDDEHIPNRRAKHGTASKAPFSASRERKAPKMYKVGELAEIVRTHDHLQPRRTNSNGTHKLREEISLGSRITSGKSGARPKSGQNSQKDRQRRSNSSPR